MTDPTGSITRAFQQKCAGDALAARELFERFCAPASDYQYRFVHQAATVAAQSRTLSVGRDPTTARPDPWPQPEQISRCGDSSPLCKNDCPS